MEWPIQKKSFFGLLFVSILFVQHIAQSIDVFVVPPGTPGVNPNPASPTNWSVAVTNIAQALSAMPANDKTIYVSNGTYYISSPLVFPNTRLNVMRSFNSGNLDPTNTIIINVSTTRCVYLDGSNEMGAIMGFTISGGLANNTHGGGVYIKQGIISNCFIIGNTSIGANAYGGGIYIEGTGLVANSVIGWNQATNYGGGIAMGSNAFAIITNCLIISNTVGSPGGTTYGGGGIHIGHRPNGTLVDCTIMNNIATNGGGALLQCNGTNFIIERCSFIGNIAKYVSGAVYGGGGIAAYSNYFGPIRNSLFYDNTNAAMRLNAIGVIEHCTIATNYVGVNSVGGGSFVNTIIYHNRLTNISLTGVNSFTNCCVFPTNGLTGTNNIASDPAFVAITSFNFKLQSGSPCINAGTTNLGWTADSLDLIGLPRTIGTTLAPYPDIGAYEYPYFALSITPSSRTNFLFSGSVSSGLSYSIFNDSINQFSVSYPQPLPVSITSDASWISFAYTNFDIPSGGTFIDFATNNAAGLTAGMYSATFVIKAANSQARDYSGSSCTGQMILNVMTLSTYPSSISNFIVEGQELGSQTFNLYSTGSGSFAYTVSIDGSPGWVTAAELGGGMTNNSTNTIHLNYDVSSLDPGIYTTAVSIISAQGGGTTQKVSLFLSVAGMEVLPRGFTNRVIKGFNATNQIFTVKSKGVGSINYVITTNIGGGNWLSVEPSSGSGTGEYDYITNIYSTASLLPGTYTGSVIVSSTNNGGMTNTVSIRLYVMDEANLMISTNYLYQAINKGANPSNFSFQLWNANGTGAVPMGYSIAVSNHPSASLLQGCSPYNGVSTGNSDTIFVYFNDLSAFSDGIYTGIVNIVASNYGSGYAGTWNAITSITVKVAVISPSAPQTLTASKGTDEGGVSLRWSPVSPPLGGTISYEVLRYVSFVSNYADVIASGLTVTNFYDSTAIPGKLYYYWVRTVNEYLQPGPLSQYDTGYRRLSAPGGVFASDGSYSNKVIVTWTETDGASSYYIGKKTEGSSIIQEVYHTSGNSFEDYPVSAGVNYIYYVKATDLICGSSWSLGDSGYALGAPTAISASDGTYEGKVRISWSAATGATSYEVWRNTRPQAPPAAGSSKIGESSSTYFDDTTGTRGATYYYWVRSKNENTQSSFSSYDTGYSATASADLYVSTFILHPGSFVLSGYPVLISVRLSNLGPAALDTSNKTVRIELYYSTSIIFGDGNERLAGSLTREITLRSGEKQIINIPASAFHMPDEPGNYYLYARIVPAYPSTLADPNLANNFARRANRVKVDPQPQVQTYRAFNDYNGDGISDLVGYKDGLWTAQTYDGIIIGTLSFGSALEVPVCGDFDGDLKSDPVLYSPFTGLWRGLLSGSGYREAYGTFASGASKLPVADHNGDGKIDVTYYFSQNGAWYSYAINSGWLLYAMPWGGTYFVPSIGDYNGDGIWDIAVYNTSTYRWYIRTISGQSIIFNEQFGQYGGVPVPGDFDGDGSWDMAIYVEQTGKWYIKTIDGRTLASGLVWGGAGYKPVAGDFNGDGVYDLAVYSPTTGYGKIRSLSGSIILQNSIWTIPGGSAVGP